MTAKESCDDGFVEKGGDVLWKRAFGLEADVGLGTDPTIVNKIKGLWGFGGRQACLLSQFSGRRLTLFYGIMNVLSGIELRGDGGTNGSLESRGLKLT